MRRNVLLAAALVIACGGHVVRAADARRAIDAARLDEGLRPCPDGGFALPGSKTCLRLSGTVEAGMSMRIAGHAHPVDGQAMPSLRAQMRGHVAVDVRMPTELGPLRVYTSVRVNDAAPLQRSRP